MCNNPSVWFSLSFSQSLTMLNVFPCVYLSSVYPLWWNVCSFPCHFYCPLFVWVVFLPLNLESSSYIQDMNHLSYILFASIFSQSVAYLLAFFLWSFFQLLSSSMYSLFSSMDHVFCFTYNKKASSNSRYQRFSPMFSFRSLIVLRFSLKSTIHLKLLVLQCLRFMLMLIFSAYGCLINAVPFLKKSILSPSIPFAFCQKYVIHICVGYFWILFYIYWSVYPATNVKSWLL